MRGKRIRLQVADARLEDVAEGVARIGRAAFEGLDTRPGDFVRISGDRSILAVVHPVPAEDEGLEIVRLDGLQRRKLGVEVGGFVELVRYDVRPAERIRLVAIGDGEAFVTSTDDLRSILGNRSLIAGDTIEVTPRRKEFQAQVNVLGLNLAEVVGASSDCGSVLLRVASTTPNGVVCVGDGTKIEMVPTGTDVVRAAEA